MLKMRDVLNSKRFCILKTVNKAPRYLYISFIMLVCVVWYTYILLLKGVIYV